MENYFLKSTINRRNTAIKLIVRPYPHISDWKSVTSFIRFKANHWMREEIAVAKRITIAIINPSIIFVVLTLIFFIKTILSLVYLNSSIYNLPPIRGINDGKRRNN